MQRFLPAAKTKPTTLRPPSNTFRIVTTVTGVGLDSTLSGSATFTVTNNTTVAGLFRIVTPDTASHNLVGTYIDTLGVNILAASGGGYNFSGYVNDTTGQFRGVASGAANALVIGARDDDNTSIAYCGTFTGTDHGTWNFTVEGNSVWGSYSPVGGDGGILEGTITGNVITLNEDGVQVATGTKSGDNVTGTWNNGNGGSGAWTGSRCN